MVPMRRRPHWSFSAVNQFLRICPAQFAFQRIWGLEPDFVAEALPFGAAFHRTVEFFWLRRTNGQDATADELATLFARMWQREVSDRPTIQFQKDDFDTLSVQGQAMMRAYREGIGELGEIVGINVPFSIPLVDGQGVPLDRPIIGEFDLLLAGAYGQIIVVDLKTAGQRYSENKIASDLQPTVYLQAARQMFPRSAVTFRWDVVLKLKKPELVSYPAERTEQDFMRLGDLARTMEHAIDSGVFIPNEGGFYCSGCGFQSLCSQPGWINPTHRARHALASA